MVHASALPLLSVVAIGTKRDIDQLLDEDVHTPQDALRDAERDVAADEMIVILRDDVSTRQDGKASSPALRELQRAIRQARRASDGGATAPGYDALAKLAARLKRRSDRFTMYYLVDLVHHFRRRVSMLQHQPYETYQRLAIDHVDGKLMMHLQDVVESAQRAGISRNSGTSRVVMIGKGQSMRDIMRGVTHHSVDPTGMTSGWSVLVEDASQTNSSLREKKTKHRLLPLDDVARALRGTSSGQPALNVTFDAMDRLIITNVHNVLTQIQDAPMSSVDDYAHIVELFAQEGVIVDQEALSMEEIMDIIGSDDESVDEEGGIIDLARLLENELPDSIYLDDIMDGLENGDDDEENSDDLMDQSGNGDDTRSDAQI